MKFIPVTIVLCAVLCWYIISVHHSYVANTPVIIGTSGRYLVAPLSNNIEPVTDIPYINTFVFVLSKEATTVLSSYLARYALLGTAGLYVFVADIVVFAGLIVHMYIPAAVGQAVAKVHHTV